MPGLLCRCWGSEFVSSNFDKKHFTDWDNLPTPNIYSYIAIPYIVPSSELRLTIFLVSLLAQGIFIDNITDKVCLTNTAFCDFKH